VEHGKICKFGHIKKFSDTASVYRNEADIGACLSELLSKHGLTRENVFITSKLGNHLVAVRNTWLCQQYIPRQNTSNLSNADVTDR